MPECHGSATSFGHNDNSDVVLNFAPITLSSCTQTQFVLVRIGTLVTKSAFISETLLLENVATLVGYNDNVYINKLTVV